MKRMKFVLAAVMLIVILTACAIPVMAYNMDVDVNMNIAFSHLYTGGLRCRYDTGTIWPTDDVSGQAEKSVSAYSGDFVWLSATVKGVSGDIGFKYHSEYCTDGDTWVYSGWTNDINNDDTAEYALYDFQGYTIYYH